MRVSSAIASSIVFLFLYGRFVVMASNASATAMILAELAELL